MATTTIEKLLYRQVTVATTDHCTTRWMGDVDEVELRRK